MFALSRKRIYRGGCFYEGGVFAEQYRKQWEINA
jgi:hypothetical protein